MPDILITLRTIATCAMALVAVSAAATRVAAERGARMAPAPPPAPRTALTFRVWELALRAQSPEHKPYADGPQVRATFRATSGVARRKGYRVSGFWDDGDIWRIRFAPPAPGE